MKMDSITIRGFRCFGEDAVTVDLSPEVTAFIGSNGSGKTALLGALLRLFGISRAERTVVPSDFHLPPGSILEDQDERSLRIEVKISFPELDGDEDSPTVPPFFRNMVVTEPGAAPFVRARIDAVWKNGPVVGGSIEESCSWIRSGEEEPGEEHISPMRQYERGLIQVHYIPASRDVSETLSRSTTAMMGRLLRAVKWSKETREAIESSVERIRDAFGAETAISQVNKMLSERWQELHRDPLHAEPEIQTIGSRFDEIVRRLAITFQPDELGAEKNISDLSDGQKSLFYFALVASVFDLEDSIRRGGTEIVQEGKEPNTTEASETGEEVDEQDQTGTLGFDPDLVHLPSLTIFAFEEPENHLSPYFLSRIIEQIRTFSQSDVAQAVLTSHSAGVPHRVFPTEIRYFRMDLDRRTVSPKPILIPSEPEDEATYVQEAVHAFPEIYFAKYVILGEGESERIVLPHLARSLGFQLDTSFVAMVPLGGRHVNHFWRLLNDLGIPYSTLLDLDLGRTRGGWDRIKYVIKQLLEIGVSSDALLTLEGSNGTPFTLEQEHIDGLVERGIDDPELELWVTHLETFGVYFSTPLDLDLLMLSKFENWYQTSAPSAPRLTPAQAADKVLGTEIAFSHYQDRGYDDLLPWYRYLFLSRSKPMTHLGALSSILLEDNASEILKQGIPNVLDRLISAATEAIRSNLEM